MPQGSPILPESARSSRAPQPPSQHQPRAGSTLWAAGWVPASWSWPSGPCCLGEQSQGPSAAPGSPWRLPPLPTRGDPALTETDSVFHWLAALSISLRTHPISPRGFSPTSLFPLRRRSAHFTGWPASRRSACYDWSEGLSIIIIGQDLVGCCPSLPPRLRPMTNAPPSRPMYALPLVSRLVCQHSRLALWVALTFLLAPSYILHSSSVPTLQDQKSTMIALKAYPSS